MVTPKLLAVVTILTLILVSPLNGRAQKSEFLNADPEVAPERQTEDSAETSIEMRASIVDRDGDQFIAMTEEGQEFRLPVEGAPANINVGDELRLVPDSETQTIQVFKAEPSQMESRKRQDSQL
jgi:hypothetical protein